ncbi:tetraspanin-33-like [Elgaria multicarinata webbii]|uniref:tetraspanin-33-like n=1 Tax=Elgaria multicarinata webbii TaxID=159646 RepID=UPI002FCCB897
MRTNQVIKYTLFASCYLFWVASGLMVAVGTYARLSKEAGAVDSLLADPSLILLVVGILMFSITFVGCLGALRDLTQMLKAFAWILLILFILQVVAAVLGFLFSGMVMEKATFLMGRAISRYRENLDLQNLIDYIQKKFECCGVHSYRDWSQNAYFDCQDSNPSLERCAVPYSCCLQGGEAVLNTMCGYEAQSLKAWRAESLVHTEGCLAKISNWARSNLLVVAGVAFGLLLLELAAFSLAVMLIFQINFIIQKRQSTRRRRRSCPEKDPSLGQGPFRAPPTAQLPSWEEASRAALPGAQLLMKCRGVPGGLSRSHTPPVAMAIDTQPQGLLPPRAHLAPG